VGIVANTYFKKGSTKEGDIEGGEEEIETAVYQELIYCCLFKR